MFCSKCGKKIDDRLIVCNECARAENSFFDAAQLNNTYVAEPMPEKPKGSRMVGFGGALTATILGDIAAAFGMIAFLFSGGFASGDLLGVCAFFAIGAIVMGIIAIVKGVKSIKVFRESTPKPIATLILGLAGIVGAALAFIFLFYVVCAIMLISL